MKLRVVAALVSLLPSALLSQSAPAQGQVVGPSCVAGRSDSGCLGAPAGRAYGQPVLGPDLTPWWRDQQGGAFIEVTRSNPRDGFGGVREGSLEMSVTGNRDASGLYSDWGFYYRYAETVGGFGRLASLSMLSFDWFRSAYTLPSVTFLDGDPNRPIPPADWEYKTPVMRLVLEYQGTIGPVRSELIWEGYYNQELALEKGGTGGKTAVDQWLTTSNMQNGNFWLAQPPTATGEPLLVAQGRACRDPFTFWQGGATGSALNQLLGSNGCLAGLDPIVVGVAVGVGSNWPLPWHGYVDNVSMGFTDDGVYRTAVNTNFDFVPVPEPASFALVGIGAVAIALANRRRQRA